MPFDPIERHAVPVLNLSGGKDSVACLVLLREFWPKLNIIWANTGDAFPETIAFMEKMDADRLSGGSYRGYETARHHP